MKNRLHCVCFYAGASLSREEESSQMPGWHFTVEMLMGRKQVGLLQDHHRQYPGRTPPLTVFLHETKAELIVHVSKPISTCRQVPKEESFQMRS